jgi:hypothetical protein
MKYWAKNDLSIFEFHDSEFSLVSFDGKDLVISASMVNIHKDTPQNPSDCDMEISSAQITFKNFHSATYEPGRTWKTGEDGKSYPVGSRLVFSGQDAIDRILEELQDEITVYHFVKKEKGTGYSIGGCGIEPYFEIEFDFDSVTVSWEEYKKKAWYELHRQYRYDAVLRTPNGDVAVKLMVNCHEEPVYCKGKLEQPPTVNVCCTFEGKEYWGHGRDYLWIDAFADLQRQLPDGVLLTCCLTCRYGNLCPVGNDKNEVFCTKDVLITQKSDLFFYTEDEVERTKRLKQYCNLCADYQPQADEYYTYNDYLYFLKKA